ncbi:predicted protein [Lichtheimia corymbifera JMRC:FSU:9682]|uniref:Uncharacterized protein n=1 Tax=Lichtheimia corymbifera JMRC:FSU:9682 TaxID=1263082 RepID=A0A068S2X7_9FUNG|nr:predicted protein [Lichtheimia corymbifera JMRC:FSU:9682]
MNKNHLSYGITLTAYVKHKGAYISKLYNETWALQSNNIARRGEAHLGCNFHDRRGQSLIYRCHHQPRRKKNSRGRPGSLWLVVTLRDSENGHDDRETFTQGALHPDEQLCSIEDPTFHCKV